MTSRASAPGNAPRPEGRSDTFRPTRRPHAMMDGRTVGRPRPVRASDGDGLPNGAHGNAMGRSRQYRRRLADAQDLRLRPNSHGFRSEEHTSELQALMRNSY